MDQEYALSLLRKMLGEGATFREGQWEAIETVALKKQRALVVQRTGWGKSLVYFLSTKMLRDQGAGPTLLISPLLALMRNQIEMAERIGIRALTIHSDNREEWGNVLEALGKDECDILLISPERLSNPEFSQKVMSQISGRIGLFVVDEAHCISDWGHDFRPDYRRIVRIINILPKNVPVLGTTATANNRVVEDVQHQLGSDLLILRGTLARESLRLQNIRLGNQSERLAWLAENVKIFKGSGIIYCMTVADTERVTNWLKQKNYSIEAYHAGHDCDMDRVDLEQRFLNNEIKVLAATTALGMGFDKPDIDFVIHYQRPGSVVAYYQQVGRAGRNLEKSYGILLNGSEDDDIQEYFIDTAFPPTQVFEEILELLERKEEVSISQILAKINVRKGMAEKALKILEVEQAIGRSLEKKNSYFRTPNPWKPDQERIDRILNLRWDELAQMQAYVDHKGCLMAFLMGALDEPDPVSCGRCANCQGRGFSAAVDENLVVEAEAFLKGNQIVLSPRKQWPYGLFLDQKINIPAEYRIEEGRTLCYYGDAGWGKLVREGKYQEQHFCDQLVDASVDLILNQWRPDPMPEWITSIPSNRHPQLVPDFASRLAAKLGLTYCPILKRMGDAPQQKTMQNSFMQAKNVVNTLYIDSQVLNNPVLLVDDIIDSRWTLTMAGYLLRKNGSGIVYPFTLAKATGRNA